MVKIENIQDIYNAIGPIIYSVIARGGSKKNVEEEIDRFVSNIIVPDLRGYANVIWKEVKNVPDF